MMRKVLAVLFIFLAADLTAQEADAGGGHLCYEMKTGFKLLPFATGELKILDVKYSDSTLIIDYSYGGGCGKSFLDLYLDAMNDFKMDQVIPLYPKFIDEDDCLALRYETACFNVKQCLKGRTKPLDFKLYGYDEIIPVYVKVERNEK